MQLPRPAAGGEGESLRGAAVAAASGNPTGLQPPSGAAAAARSAGAVPPGAAAALSGELRGLAAAGPAGGGAARAGALGPLWGWGSPAAAAAGAGADVAAARPRAPLVKGGVPGPRPAPPAGGGNLFSRLSVSPAVPPRSEPPEPDRRGPSAQYVRCPLSRSRMTTVENENEVKHHGLLYYSSAPGGKSRIP
nr:circumsporozoite protein-like [Dasypus novemcinctus]